MPLYLKDIKRELQKDKYLKGRKKDGSYKFEPPSIVSRQLKDYTNLKITKFDQVIRQGIKSIDFSGMVNSETTSGLKYRVTVRFLNILFNKQESPETTVRAKDQEDEVIFYGTPDIKNNSVMLRCQCNDFRHRFEHELADASALIGAPRKYKRLTPIWPIGRPYANSTHKIGVCKHIHSMLFYLKSKKIISGSL